MVVEEIKKIAKPVETKEAIAQVASISAGDEEIGNLVAEAMEKVGRDGVITVEESQSVGMTLDVVEVCSSTGAISRRIWLPTRTPWKQSWRTPTF